MEKAGDVICSRTGEQGEAGKGNVESSKKMGRPRCTFMPRTVLPVVRQPLPQLLVRWLCAAAEDKYKGALVRPGTRTRQLLWKQEGEIPLLKKKRL
jgi:hypothetical protein